VDALSYCPKCGNKIEEDMVFCPKCGASLKGEQTAVPPRPVTYRHEKEEKHEKHEKEEKGEKAEKHEKGEYAFIDPLIGGLILIFIGLSAYLSMTGMVQSRVWGALFFIAVGLIIIVGVIYGAVLASRRHPKT
jgi:transcription initiation factor TFIIIB Brf1 subunit/transcription initiation factor TFIIB